jgi:hypothetical protein
MLRNSGDYDWKEAIRETEIFMHFSGVVTYDDIFGNGYETKFRYVWEADGFDLGGKWQDISHWAKSATDNHAT